MGSRKTWNSTAITSVFEVYLKQTTINGAYTHRNSRPVKRDMQSKDQGCEHDAMDENSNCDTNKNEGKDSVTVDNL